MNKYKGFSDIITDTRIAGAKRYYLGYPKDWNMEIPKEILNCVAFIYTQEKNDEAERNIPRGTGFFVGVYSETGDGGLYMYFVTAKHIIEKIGKKDMSIRLNTNSGAIHIQMEGGFPWFFHPADENVDVAVTPFSVNDIEFGGKEPSFLSERMFLNSKNIENEDIQVGHDALIAGLFTQHDGRFGNLPIVRIGNIAMLPNENEKVSVSWHDAKIDAYLIEARSIGGLSGSPVFFREPYFKEGGKGVLIGNVAIRPKPRFYLGGLIHGHWRIDDAKIDNEDSFGEEKNVNMGIAIVIPASKILETLMQSELKEIRKRKDEAFKNKNNAKPD